MDLEILKLYTDKPKEIIFTRLFQLSDLRYEYTRELLLNANNNKIELNKLLDFVDEVRDLTNGLDIYTMLSEYDINLIPLEVVLSCVSEDIKKLIEEIFTNNFGIILKG